MIGFAIRFPAGRYHATPWGAHVNEAAVEWPPSPWRLLRALASAWHRTAPDLPAGEVAAVLGALAAPPSYRLPAAVAPGHTRHYMPDGAHRREVRLSQNLVFDAFLHIAEGEPLTVAWDVDLSEPALSVLRRLAAGVTYLGRSESWCDVEVVEGDQGAADVVPQGEGTAVARNQEVVRLLAPERPLDLAALEVSTADLQSGRSRRRDPPGARWLRYARPAAWARPRGRRPPERLSRAVAARAVVWALEGIGGPAPLLTEVEEVVRAVRAAIRLSQTEATGALRVLAYPSDLDALPLRLDRVALWAERGLDAGELERACGLGPFSLPGASSEQMPLLLAHGDPADLGGDVFGALFGPGRRWRSVTPFLPWPQVRLDRTALAESLASPAELIPAALPAGRGTPTVLRPAGGPGRMRWLEFRCGPAFGACLELPEPVTGPVVAHCRRPGFGLFLCEEVEK